MTMSFTSSDLIKRLQQLEADNGGPLPIYVSKRGVEYEVPANEIEIREEEGTGDAGFVHIPEMPKRLYIYHSS